MAEDARDVLPEMIAALRAWPRTLRARMKRSEDVAKNEARRYAPVRTGALRAGIDARVVRPDRLALSFPGNYQPIASGVPSRNIPTNDFAERGIESAQDEIELSIADLQKGLMGRVG